MEEMNQTLALLKESAEQECDTNDKWQLRRGQIQAFTFVANLPVLLENRLAYLTQPEVEEDV